MKTNLKNVMAILAVLMLVCGSAHAVVVTNGATTLVSDGFEGYALGVAPPAPWAGGLQVWAPISGYVDNNTPPGASEGSNYLRLERLSLGVPGESVSFAPQTSGTVKLAFMANTGSAGGASGILLRNATSDVFQMNIIGHTSGLTPGVYIYSGGFQNSGLGWSDNVWKKIEFEYTIGAAAAILKVDGVTAAIPMPPISGSPVSSLQRVDFFVGSTYGTLLNIDAIPEPATMILLSLGGLLLRRRKA